MLFLPVLFSQVNFFDEYNFSLRFKNIFTSKEEMEKDHDNCVY